jgi:hypothetical protein
MRRKKTKMSGKQLHDARAACFGPFLAGVVLLSGEFNYAAATVDGTFEPRRVKFWTEVWLFNEESAGIPRSPSYEYAAKFRVEGNNYQHQVSIGQELKAGEADRFLVKIDFEKSSHHRFRARLRFNGGRELTSPPIELHSFVPRSGIRFFRERKDTVDDNRG